jgi:NhaP-type Na+/H+ or K+/H+ antiporter
MKWELAIIAATVLAVAGVSRRLTGTPVAPAMMFVVVGVLVGPLVIDEVTAARTGEGVRTLAEATLAVVLFADASRIKPRVLRREYAVPLRLLGIGLPLTIALGEAVVTELRLPSRIRQGLNVESGLNDGICVPLLLIALAAADVEDKVNRRPPRGPHRGRADRLRDPRRRGRGRGRRRRRRARLSP